MTRSMMLNMAPLTLTLAALGATAKAQTYVAPCRSGNCPRPATYQAPPVYYRATYTPGATRYATPAQEPRLLPTAYHAAAPAAVATTTGDILGPVNRIRAEFGWSPLAWDGNLAAWAASNSSTCARARTMGHLVQCAGAAQCVAWTGDPGQAAGQWRNSPAHLNLILAARSAAGIDYTGGIATLNLR
jgi:uncharacterized protein YkwD